MREERWRERGEKGREERREIESGGEGLVEVRELHIKREEKEWGRGEIERGGERG